MNAHLDDIASAVRRRRVVDAARETKTDIEVGWVLSPNPALGHDMQLQRRGGPPGTTAVRTLRGPGDKFRDDCRDLPCRTGGRPQFN